MSIVLRFLKNLTKRTRRPEARIEPAVRFLCEQDGPIERELKATWLPLLDGTAHVRRAYLVRTSYGDPDAYEVALVIRSTTDEDLALVQALADRFAKHFGRDTHLDITFLSDAEEAQVSRVSAPFYARAS